ncbi:YesL family protein [Psychrobacillus sp. FJAT-51614]|uniref:YesL family protein n=1 Tax=Psychrobacillus mangrovi TaxID=3117745 RepID=A0ABU8F0B9_9BACI
MELTGWRGAIYRYMDLAMKLAYLNILWLVGIFIGLGIVGFFPSTVAMFSVIRKMQDDDIDIKIFTHFKREYKKEFIKSNLFGYTWAILGLIIYVDLLFFRGISTLWSLIISFFIFILGAIYVASLLYAFPLYVHYKLNFKQYFKNCLLIVLSNPLFAVLMVLGFYFPYYFMIKVPGLIPFFGGSLISFILMSISNKLFTSLEGVKSPNYERNEKNY